MKEALILAAGRGTRLMPLTSNTPKPLIEVNGKPFLFYVIKNLHKAGITDLKIIVGYKKEKIAEFLKRYNIKATLIFQEEQKGTGHAVLTSRKYMGKEFLVVSGDNLFSSNDIKAIANNKSDYVIGALKHENPEQYGVLITRKNKLISIVEKPKVFVGNLINVGLYKFHHHIFSVLENIKESERGEIELTDAITQIAQTHHFEVFPLKDYWLDLGKKEDIPKIAEFLKKVGE
ncbi:hypothetical protein D6745_00785 [Candidatus Woesearchaeota archaeon]|nr:MAG: hypothetical protein D6745_00785 [Candidatus Woesearchaeota archaeon]